jgi:hypothetical protein
MLQAALVSCWPWVVALALTCAAIAALVQGPMSKVQGRWKEFSTWDFRLWTLDLHRDQRGSVQSLSFVLTVPVFIMLMMLAVQITQLMIGEIMVNYAAYAAARAASVWVPARIGDPIAMPQPLELANWLNLRTITGTDVTGGAATISPKAVQIYRAAALACVPIAPSRDLGLVNANDPTTQSLLAMFAAYSTSAQTNSRLPMRLANKWAYASQATMVQISTFHRQYGTALSSYQNEPPLWDSEPIDPERYYKPTELGWRDEITVKVTHNFALLPGPGRLLAKSGSAGNRIGQISNVYFVPLSASATMVPEGDKSIAPYVYSAN